MGDPSNGPWQDWQAETLTALARKHQVPGAQLAIHHRGETVATEVGELEHGSGRRVTRDAAFPIGSISKTFTATVAMILVADGDLELDTPLGWYVPELDGLGTQLTLRQVLSHTSGLASDPASETVSSTSMRRYVLDHCRHDHLVLPPGTCFSYSNMGYVLAGHLVEVITGMDWWEAVESILLRPLSIEPTFIVAPEARPAGRPIATGHSVNTATGRTRPAEQSLARAEAPAGALAVSAQDLVGLGLLHLGAGAPDLLPAADAELMRQAVPGAEPVGLADGWGLGLAVFQQGDAVWVGHDGNADGTACSLRVDPVNQCVVAFTSNANIGLGMWQELVDTLRTAGLPITSDPAAGTPGQPTAPPPGCVGSYRNGNTEYSVTVQDDGEHRLVVDGEAVARLTFHEDMLFEQRDVATGQRMHPGRFLRDPITGALDRVLVNGRVGRRIDSRHPRNGAVLDRAS